MHVIRLSSPAAALQQYVRFYAHREARLGNTSIVHPVPARATPAIEFTFGNLYEVHCCDRAVVETAPRSVIVGLQTYRRVRLRLTGKIESFAIFFQPAALHRLFSIPMHEITNSDHEASAVLGPSISELEQRLGASRSFEERIRITDDYLLRRCLTSPRSDSVWRAAQKILRCKGHIHISSLAHQAGVSLRQFERRFMQQVGVSPKLYARIARFEAALESKAISTAESWTDVAHQLGYYDQMHMIHDFRQFSGDIPTKLLGKLEMVYDAHIEAVRSGQIAPTDGAPRLIL
jgi:AraC-like DNA-binding protein